MPGGRGRQAGRRPRHPQRQDDRGPQHRLRGTPGAADALSLAAEEEPDAIVDLATLTGACVTALGPSRSPASWATTNPGSSRRRSQPPPGAGRAHLAAAPPGGLEPGRHRLDVADMKNHLKRWGGTLTAGLPLKVVSRRRSGLGRPRHRRSLANITTTRAKRDPKGSMASGSGTR